MAYGLPGVKDPLDTLTFIVFGVLIAVVGGCVNGYALYILPGLCGGLVYLHSKTNAVSATVVHLLPLRSVFLLAAGVTTRVVFATPPALTSLQPLQITIGRKGAWRLFGDMLPVVQ